MPRIHEWFEKQKISHCQGAKHLVVLTASITHVARHAQDAEQDDEESYVFDYWYT